MKVNLHVVLSGRFTVAYFNFLRSLASKSLASPIHSIVESRLVGIVPFLYLLVAWVIAVKVLTKLNIMAKTPEVTSNASTWNCFLDTLGA